MLSMQCSCSSYSIRIELVISCFFLSLQPNKGCARVGMRLCCCVSLTIWPTIRTRIYCSCKFYWKETRKRYFLCKYFGFEIGHFRQSAWPFETISNTIQNSHHLYASDACPCIIYNCTLFHHYAPFSTVFRRSKLCVWKNCWDLFFNASSE